MKKSLHRFLVLGIVSSFFWTVETHPASASSISMDELSYNFLMHTPNKTNPQNLTYSIRGISKRNPLYQATVDGIQMWNISNYVEFTHEALPSEAKVNNHVFINFTDNVHPQNWGGSASCTNRVFFYKKARSYDLPMMKKLTAHEVGHLLGFNDETVENILMSHIVNRDVEVTKKYRDGLNFRYNTDKGKQLFNPIEEMPKIQRCHDRAVQNIDDSMSGNYWN